MTDQVKGNCQSDIRESDDSVQNSDCLEKGVDHDTIDPESNEKVLAFSSGCESASGAREVVLENGDVCTTPKSLLQEVLIVLDVLGPWCK